MTAKTIWKFVLAEGSLQKIRMPKDAKVLTVQMQHGTACLWVLVDPVANEEDRWFRVYGTGHDIQDEGTYIGTFQMKGGLYIFHVFECSR